MKKFIVSALLVTGAMFAQTATPPAANPTPANQTAPKAKKTHKHKKAAATTTTTAPTPAPEKK